MQMLLMAILALLLMAAAGYAQQRIHLFTKSGTRVMMTRVLLALVGVAFGLLGAADFKERSLQLLAFVIGFGLVHLPAAVILFIKGRRGAGRS
jgi:uncharacterized protein YacL